MTFDYLADLIYLIDMTCVQPRVKYLHEGFWVIDIKLLRSNYMKSRRFKVNYNINNILPLTKIIYFDPINQNCVDIFTQIFYNIAKSKII